MRYFYDAKQYKEKKSDLNGSPLFTQGVYTIPNGIPNTVIQCENYNKPPKEYVSVVSYTLTPWYSKNKESLIIGLETGFFFSHMQFIFLFVVHFQVSRSNCYAHCLYQVLI